MQNPYAVAAGNYHRSGNDKAETAQREAKEEAAAECDYYRCASDEAEAAEAAEHQAKQKA